MLSPVNFIRPPIEDDSVQSQEKVVKSRKEQVLLTSRKVLSAVMRHHPFRSFVALRRKRKHSREILTFSKE